MQIITNQFNNPIDIRDINETQTIVKFYQIQYFAVPTINKPIQNNCSNRKQYFPECGIQIQWLGT